MQKELHIPGRGLRGRTADPWYNQDGSRFGERDTLCQRSEREDEMKVSEKLKEMKLDVFRMFDEQWALISAGTAEANNTMTISWGSLGTLWGHANDGRPIVTAYIRPERRTHDYLEECDTFSVCFFPEEYRKDLAYLGAKSGHDEPDKLAHTGLHLKMAGEGITYEEAELTFVCRKLYRQDFDAAGFPEDVKEVFYQPGNGVHTMYIGEVIDVIVNKTDM